jgi:hypothetical protein
MDNLEFYHINFQYGFAFKIHIQSQKNTIVISSNSFPHYIFAL